jgi:hypothetical protein
MTSKLNEYQRGILEDAARVSRKLGRSAYRAIAGTGDDNTDRQRQCCAGTEIFLRRYL